MRRRSVEYAHHRRLHAHAGQGPDGRRARAAASTGWRSASRTTAPGSQRGEVQGRRRRGSARRPNPVASTWGSITSNTRMQTAEQSGLTKADFANLELAWAAAFPQTPTMRSQPVIVGDTIFVVASDAGRMYALDTNTGCVKWQYESAGAAALLAQPMARSRKRQAGDRRGRRRRLRRRRRCADRQAGLALRCRACTSPTASPARR